MDNKIEIGNRIKFRREQLGMTQEQLGAKLGLNKSTIQRYEKGIVEKIKLPVIQAMAKELNVNPNWLVLKTDDMGQYTDEDNELNEYLEELKNRSEMRMLFKLTKSATKEDVMKAVKIIEALKGESEDE